MRNGQILRGSQSQRLHWIGQVRLVQEFLPPRDTVAAFDEDPKEAKTWRELSDAWDAPGGAPWDVFGGTLEICALLRNISEYIIYNQLERHFYLFGMATKYDMCYCIPSWIVIVYPVLGGTAINAKYSP